MAMWEGECGLVDVTGVGEWWQVVLRCGRLECRAVAGWVQAVELAQCALDCTVVAC